MELCESEIYKHNLHPIEELNAFATRLLHIGGFTNDNFDAKQRSSTVDILQPEEFTVQALCSLVAALKPELSAQCQQLAEMPQKQMAEGILGLLQNDCNVCTQFMRPLDLLESDPAKMQILVDQLYKDPASLDEILERQRGQKPCLPPDVLE